MIKIVPKSSWQALHLTQTGLSHEERGVECQDAAVAIRINDTLYFAVADGAGSKRHSAIGSKVAVAAAVRWLKARAPSPIDPNWPDSMRQAISAVRTTLVQKARALNVPLEELSTTLLLAIVTPEHAIAAHVGDGACVLRVGKSSYRTLTVARREGFANETEFVTERRLDLRLAVYRGPILGVAAFSDGLEAGALLGRHEPHVAFFDPLFSWLQAESPPIGRERIREFLRSDHLRSHTDDDCSLVIGQVMES